LKTIEDAVEVRNRFLSGGASYSVQRESGGGVSHSVDWHHTQQFTVSTDLSLDMHYSTNSALIAPGNKRLASMICVFNLNCLQLNNKTLEI